MNCYFPTDPQSILYNVEELSTVLDQIEYILDDNVYNDCITGGDFNSPIMMKIKVGQVKVKVTKPDTHHPRRPAWYKATQENADDYTRT